MGWLSRLLGREGADDDSPVAPRMLDQDARRAQLGELEAALEELVTAMDSPPSPVENPGWVGRIKDYNHHLGTTTMLQKQPVTREALVELTAGMRPLFTTGQPVPAGLEHLVPLSDRVITLTRQLEEPLPSEA
ncbi:hypothetical protein [Microlunatus sp. Y2014]|uniref:hypothetical protein n=1 Tax=Microlunatus sp. Y2014 TaxID=3418488 RepID=UPI003DA767D7